MIKSSKSKLSFIQQDNDPKHVLNRVKGCLIMHYDLNPEMK